MRRLTALLAGVTAAILFPALSAPAGAADGARTAPGAPGGWETVDAHEFASLTDERPRSAEAEPPVVGFRSVTNDKFTAAELNYGAPRTGVLRARSADPGGWESFIMEWDETTESYSLKSTGNGRYVAVEKNFSGATKNVLRARSTEVGSWERFQLYYSETLDRWALRSKLNGMFVTMENSYSGDLRYVLRARSSDIGGWEEFILYDLGR